MKSSLKNIGRIALTALALTACRKETPSVPDIAAFPVNVEKAARRPLEETLAFVGSLKARDEAVLFSRVPGKLMSYPLKEGSPVSKGDTVALVERDEVGVDYKPAPVPSPLNGLVARTYLDKGANVKDDTPLALVIDPTEILARADIPERYAGKIHTGQAARITLSAMNGTRFDGTVSLVSPSIDSATRSFPIEIRINGSKSGLKSGMFADLAVIIDRKNAALAIPLSAIVGEDDGKPAVFVVEGGKALRRPVRIGLKTDDAVEILDGITEGTEVVTFGTFALQDGSPVDVLKKSDGTVR
jgi:multidrug efflux pump subunit AcrA (membrane-fusion protein)